MNRLDNNLGQLQIVPWMSNVAHGPLVSVGYKSWSCVQNACVFVKIFFSTNLEFMGLFSISNPHIYDQKLYRFFPVSSPCSELVCLLHRLCIYPSIWRYNSSQIVEAMPQNEEVQAFMEKLGSFYEIVDEDSPVPRVPKDSPALQTENHIPAEDETDENTGKHILNLA